MKERMKHMELQQCLTERRSIRKYKDTPVTQEQIKELIGAAILAPSWKNSQVSRYYVTDTLEKTKQFLPCLPEFNQNNIQNAPVVIVSTVVKNRSGFERDGSFSTPLENGWQYFDNGLQVQNICLKAQELGLGTLIMGIYDHEKIREFFHIPDTEEIVAVLSVGYADIHPEMPKRKSVEEICTFL